MKRISYLILLASVCYSVAAVAQDTRADSLFAIWSDTTNTALDRVEAFYQRFNPIIVIIEQNNPEAVRWVNQYKEVQELAKKVGKTEYLPRLQILEIGYYMLVKGEPAKGCQLAQKVIRQAIALKDFNSAIAYLQIISTCPGIDIVEFEPDLLAHLQELQKHNDNTSQSEDLLNFTNELGQFYYRLSHFPKALELFQYIIQNCEKMSLQNEAYANSLSLSGAIHRYVGNLEEAEQYLIKALEVDRLAQDTYYIASSMIDLAQVYIQKKDLPAAQSYLDSANVFYATESSNRPGCEPCAMRVRRVKADVYNLAGDYQAALNELIEQRSFYDANGGDINVLHTMRYYVVLGNTYLGLKRYKEAIKTAEKGLALHPSIRIFGGAELYKILYTAQEASGNYKAALTAYRNYNSSYDTLVSFRNSQKVTRLELENQFQQQRLADSLQVEQKRLEGELVLQAEINQQKTSRNIIVGIGLAVLLIALGLWQRLRYIRKTKAVLEEKNAIIEQEKDKAQASEKAKHQFLANMSHEIRTPMNAIKGMTDILLRRDPKKAQLTYLNGIKQSSDSLLVIINDILDLSKIEVGKVNLETILFSISEVVQNVHTIMQFKAEEKGLDLLLRVSDDLPQVLGDPARLNQVLLNLVGNAVKFTERGLVTISVNQEAQQAEQVQVRFTVSDTGIGIGEDRLEEIFDSFEQAYSDTTRKFGGTGLGLSISKKLVELHGGKIWVESSKGKGSQFHFTIPYLISDEKTTAIAETSNTTETHPADSLQGVRVLLVEDNAFNALVAQEELEDAIAEVIVEVVENGAIAVEKVKTSDFDLILMDVQMPVMNGYEATQKIRLQDAAKAQIPIIAMTANVMQEEVDRCMEAGMDAFVSKPFDTDDLLQKMQQLLSKKISS